MKNGFRLIGLGLLLAPLVVLFYLAFSSDLVVLHDAQRIIVDDVRMSGDQIICQAGDEIRTFQIIGIQRLVAGFPTSIAELQLRGELLTHKLAQIQTWKPGDSVFQGTKRYGARQKRLVGGWLVCTLLLAAAGLFFLVAAKRHRKSASIADANVCEPGPEKGAATVRLASRSDIEAYFLDLYRAQLGADEVSPGRCERLEPLPDNKGDRYQLNVYHKNEWRSRRMTVTALGDRVSSKSNCYYIIFDTHLVVKIPPDPICDFSEYMARISKERRILEQLQGRECIIPNLRVILARLHLFPGADRLDSNRLEKLCARWINENPEYQKYFKLGGAFAFFMDLSRYYFLSHALEHISDAATTRRAVISEDAVLSNDYPSFEEKYGSKYGWISFELQRLASEFTQAASELNPTTDGAVVINEKQKQEWLFACLGGSRPDRSVKGLSDEFYDRRDTYLQKMVHENADLVIAYRRVAEQCAQQRAFRQNKPRMVALATNLLILLDWLGGRHVAIRDLKPDNLLVAGNPKDYPLFLANADDFAIGLIDVETACICRTPSGESEQPQLGGTPYYATPSHFFNNQILGKVYSDIAEVLHLQDWQAIGAIIFEVITGERLFRETSRFIPRMFRYVRAAIAAGQDIADIYRVASRHFWHAARKEMELRIAVNRHWLVDLPVLVPETIQVRMDIFLEQQTKTISKKIESRISRQKLIVDAQQKNKLAQASVRKLEMLLDKYQNSNAEKAPSLAKILASILKLRKRLELWKELQSALEQPRVTMPIHSLLLLMFDMVAETMCPPSWAKKTLDVQIPAFDLTDLSPLPLDEESTLGLTQSAVMVQGGDGDVN